ncbi:Glutathione gamma-glutamylcysteinyltransferase 1 [Hondaea fermentalgiana]|uniref:glutathione gamma-glutamylcysteinyltransferase n=1 Tax=Hondaea fermentalgiana TaxID=2315210 RepID=A0A2R5GQC7_9STRA|nr:Glutathione gamma-glutamylcysteinyltransferase 1 [Hondaea fermentalgiana]|eukprot:GBG30561.1 Glutathione gamma-glutamylcysteinyltransferase 1 [Hondaea fermentalgiana]
MAEDDSPPTPNASVDKRQKSSRSETATTSRKSWLERAFRKQVGDTACGLASLAVVVDALHLKLHEADEPLEQPRGRTQEDEVLAWQRTPEHGAKDAVSMTNVKARGMTLAQLSQLSWNAGILHVCCYADRFKDADEFRDTLQAALGGPCMVIMNYNMTIAGQTPFKGHFSPLDCYNADNDTFRILDVWKLTPTDDYWAETTKLWEAAADQDSDAKRCRGFLVIAPSAPQFLALSSEHRPVAIERSQNEDIGVLVRLPGDRIVTKKHIQDWQISGVSDLNEQILALLKAGISQLEPFMAFGEP